LKYKLYKIYIKLAEIKYSFVYKKMNEDLGIDEKYISDVIQDTVKKKRNCKSKIPYKCIKCGYETIQKTDMRKHLYTLKNECQGILNNINLTIEIKECILANRIYIIPEVDKSKEKAEVKRLENERKAEEKRLEHERKKELLTGIQNYIDSDVHYVYLIKPRANVFNKDNVLEIGRHIQKIRSVNISRMSGYGDGSEIILIQKCIDCVSLEMKIKIRLNELYPRPYGVETFIGDENIIRRIINKMVDDQEDEEKEKQKILQEKLEEFNTMVLNKNNNMIVKERRGSF
jgi:hypothetical protein